MCGVNDGKKHKSLPCLLCPSIKTCSSSWLPSNASHCLPVLHGPSALSTSQRLNPFRYRRIICIYIVADVPDKREHIPSYQRNYIGLVRPSIIATGSEHRNKRGCTVRSSSGSVFRTRLTSHFT